MRVLMVGDSRVVHARRPLQWLLSEGVEVLLLDTAARPYEMIGRGLTRRPFPREFRSYRLSQVATRVGPWFQSLTESALDPFTWRELRGVHADFRPQIVHVHWIDRQAYHCAQARLAPLVLSAWGTDINRLFPLDQGDAAIVRLRRKVSHALAHCACLITDAPDLVRRCEELAGRPLNHRLLPLGIDSARFARDLAVERARWRRQLELPEGAFVVGSFREMRPQYGHHLILEAFARAAPALPPETFMLFKPYYSEGRAREPEYEPSIAKRAAELGIAARLRWAREITDDTLPELYATVDALVNYPVMDGFPVHFLEAAASSKPVITCRHPAYEWGFAQDSFRFVERGDLTALAEALREVVVETSAGAAMRRVRAAAETVASRYDERATVAELLQIYNQQLR